MTTKPTFTFGRNWLRYLKNYTPERQEIARKALLAFLRLDNLEGKTFLDIGSGSGIHSAAAFLSGAKQVYSFDYDPDSVAATRHLHQMLGAPPNWAIDQASVLDDSFMKSLGKFDIVYSWGVLHHTGDQWHALANACRCLHDKSRLFIALYSKEAYSQQLFRDWTYWHDIKRRYNKAGFFGRFCMEVYHIWDMHLGREFRKIPTLPSLFWNYKKSRGMALMSDVRDWLGGWPTEFSSVPEVYAFCNGKHNLELLNLNVGAGNTEFLFAKPEYITSLGQPIIDHRYHPLAAPVLRPDAVLSKDQQIWVFGSAKGATILHNHLKTKGYKVEGFIDLAPQVDEKEGLPVLSIEQFAQQTDKNVLVIISTKYVLQNLALLQKHGFYNVMNANSEAQSLVTTLYLENKEFYDSII